MLRNVKTLLTDPDSFFEEMIGESGIVMEVVLVFLVGIAGSLGMLYAATEILNSLQGAVEFIRINLIGQGLRVLLFAFVIWLVYSIGVHAVAKMYNGRGPITRVMKLSAWAFVPLLIGNLVHSLITYFAYRGTDFPEIAPSSNAGEAVSEMLALGDSLLLALSELVLIVFVLWTAYLMVFAVKHAKGLSRDEAIYPVAVVAGLHVLYLLWSAVGHLGIL